MSIPNSLTITSNGDRKLLIYIATVGLSAEFGRCLMLDLWRLPCIFSETDSDVLFFLLWFPLSALVSADLLYVNSLCWGLSLLQVVLLPSLISCRPLFFFFFSGGPLLVFMLAWQIWGLEIKPRYSLVPLPCHSSQAWLHAYCLFKWESPSVNCVPNYNTDMPSDW